MRDAVDQGAQRPEEVRHTSRRGIAHYTLLRKVFGGGVSPAPPSSFLLSGVVPPTCPGRLRSYSRATPTGVRSGARTRFAEPCSYSPSHPMPCRRRTVHRASPHRHHFHAAANVLARPWCVDFLDLSFSLKPLDISRLACKLVVSSEERSRALPDSPYNKAYGESGKALRT
jgi:hypothetical protein